MAYALEFNLKGTEALTVSQVNEQLKRSLVAMGKHWRRNFLDDHFTPEGAKKYRYAKRAGQRGEFGSRNPKPGSYTWRKLKDQGHTDPLVYTGELRRLALYSAPKIKATAVKRGVKATIRISMPRKANLKNPRSRVHPIKELNRTIAAERKKMATFLTEDIERRLKRAGATAKAKVSFGFVR